MLPIFLSMDQPDDRELIAEIYASNYQLMLKVAMGMLGDSNAAQEQVQEAALVLVKKVGILHLLTPNQQAAFCATTVRLTSYGYLRRKRRAPDIFSLEDDVFINADEPEEAYLREEERERLARALSRLKARDRDLLMFKYLLGLSGHEISEKLGIAPASVWQLLAQARQRARRQMEDDRR